MGVCPTNAHNYRYPPPSLYTHKLYIQDAGGDTEEFAKLVNARDELLLYVPK
jgi:hypothetical protein